MQIEADRWLVWPDVWVKRNVHLRPKADAFRLAISGNKVRMGSFRLREFDLDDVTEFKQERGQGAELVLTLAGGKKVHISGLPTDFDELSDLILFRTKSAT